MFAAFLGYLTGVVLVGIAIIAALEIADVLIDYFFKWED
jgi:hypothetical protein